jgi:hypothetical protein
MEYLNYLSATWGPSVMKHSTISTNRFDWFPIAREFVAEASDLKDLVLWRVYEDAADIGFGIKSAKTGKIEYLVETHNQESEEGELLWTEYRAIRGDNGAVERGWKVVILND